MESHHKITVPLGHRLDMAEALRFLLHRLDCDSWYVACHHEHLFVAHLTRNSRKRYAVCMECTFPVEKGIYHGSKLSSLSILPLGSEHDLAPESAAELKRGLLELAAAMPA